jgi:glycosyltransferase involved in cell wall biosynthesis
MPNKFSIAMSTFNGARHLRQQLDSIAGQTRLPDELVICDDGSTDTTRAIIAEFAASVSFRVHSYFNDQNLGSTKTFERAIHYCEGDLISLCDQDDVWMPERLARLETEFDRTPDVGLIFTDAVVIDEFARPMGYTLWEKLPLGRHDLHRVRGRRAIDELLQGSTVTGATMAFRGKFKELVLPIPDDLLIIHDAWIAILIAAVSEVLPIVTPLSKYRQHPNQQVGAKEKKRDRDGIRKAFRRAASHDQLIRIGRRVEQRLTERKGGYQSDQALARLRARLTHLQTRTDLPKDQLSRFGIVITEVLTGRYHVYSRGLFSAAKDLLRKDRENL